MDRVLTGKIKAQVLNGGMDLVGFAPVERWESAPFLLSPQAVLPGSKTVIVTGIHITDTWTEMGGEPDPQTLGPGGWMDQNALLDRTSYKVAKELKKHGYKAIPVTASNIWRYREFADVKSLFAPDLSHMHAAVAAGLAEMGWSGLAITPEFGPRVRFTSIVTDAVLEPTPMYDGPALCDMCMDCVRSCPSFAMKKDFNDKPHEVMIGGKTFKYANKNIWRCAWAEHFSLDLKASALQADHIDENTVVKELNEKGPVGHERGVCQKVCIPPHLRSKEPSFGRSDKLISQNRINKRYPDSMPTLRKMRDDIIAKAVGMGIEIAEIAHLDVNSKVGKAVIAEVPDMKTVFAFAFSVPKEIPELSKYSSYEKDAYEYAIATKIHHIMIRIARIIEDYGYHAASYFAGAQTDHSSLKEKVAKATYGGSTNLHNDVDLMAYELAQMTGLGKIEDMFVTDEFGCNMVVGAVVTDAVIEALPKGKNESARTLKQPKNLRGTLECLANDNGISLFGVASADMFDKTVQDLKANINEAELGQKVIDDNTKLVHHGKFIPKIVEEELKIHTPQHFVKDAKSVIVIGMDFPTELLENSGLDSTKQIGTYAFYSFQTTYELRFAAMELAGYLNKIGYKTLVSENMLGVGSMVDTPRGKMPDFRCNALEAVAAGLGEIGRNGGVLTPEFGAHQRFITIITDAVLTPDAIYEGDKVCSDCGNCVTKCPMVANSDSSFQVHIGDKIIEYPIISRHRCDWAKRYSLHKDEGPEMIGNTTHVVPSHIGKITIEEIAEACCQKDEIMKLRTVILEPCLKLCKANIKKA